MFALARDVSERKVVEKAMLEQARDLAVLEERNRMAREIHDTLAQGFTGIIVQLEAAEQAMDGHADEAPHHLTRAKALARESLQEARRSVWNLLPQVLEERPLVDALRDEVQQFAAEGSEQASFHVSGRRRNLASDIQTGLLRICQESLTNVRRHAAAANVTVTLAFTAEAVSLDINDDGRGFNPQSLARGKSPSGFGLSGIGQRARILGGNVEVKSRKGKGTRVRVTVPVK